MYARVGDVVRGCVCVCVCVWVCTGCVTHLTTCMLSHGAVQGGGVLLTLCIAASDMMSLSDRPLWETIHYDHASSAGLLAAAVRVRTRMRSNTPIVNPIVNPIMNPISLSLLVNRITNMDT